MNARTAITAIDLLMEAADFEQEQLVLLLAGRNRAAAGFPGVVTAAAHAQSAGQFGDGVVAVHGVNQGVTFGSGPSESTPMAFFKMSRWRRSASFSLRKARNSCSSCLAGMGLPS